MLKHLIKKKYGMNVISIEKSSVGAGSDTYFIECEEGKFVAKFPSVSEINDINAEPALCEFLLGKGINVCEFIKNGVGEYVTIANDGRLFHLQKFIKGRLYDWNTAPDWLLEDSAKTLGKIHAALKSYPKLPVGIGVAFLKSMTPEKALKSYQKSLEKAKSIENSSVENDLLYRIGLMQRFPKYEFDMARFSCGNTHGDYFISQFICGEQGINAVIDWTTACIHPFVWEILRSYLYSAPECANGEIISDRLIGYFKSYLKFSPLNEYDIQNAAKLFYYQIAVCYYYGQYFGSSAANRDIYLNQAVFSTKLMRWFDENIDSLTEQMTIKLL